MSNLVNNQFEHSLIEMPPSGWEIKKIHDLCFLGRGRVISQTELDRHPGPYPVYSSQSRDSGIFGYLNTFDFEGEYVTWTTDGAYAGTVFYRSGQFSCTNVCGTLKQRDTELDMHYLATALASRAYNYVSYVGNPKLMNNVMGEIALLIPPLPEQHSIAKILDAIDDEIQTSEKLIAKLKLMQAGLLQTLLTCGINENGEVREPTKKPEDFKRIGQRKMPKDWEIDKLLNHVVFPNGQVDPKQSPYRDWPLIAPDHIEQGTGKLLKIETASQQNAISGKYRFQANDVLYSKIRPYLKKAVLASGEGLCSADMYPLRCKATLVSRFLLAIILSEHFSHFAITVSMRSGFPKINRQELSEYQLLLPPYQEQQRIVKVINGHESALHTEESYLAKLRMLKQGLMQDLLTGRVRVTELNVADL